MKRLFIFFVALAILLSACAAPTADIPAASPGPSAQATATPSATVSLALDLTPDPLTPDTPTVTPLPTIPTFTPTFDVRTIFTATPAPKAECPKENGFISADFQIPTDGEPILIGVETSILNFLNSGGSIQSVIERLGGKGSSHIQDVTGDGVPELLLKDFGITPRLRVFTCKNGGYEMLTPKFSINDDEFSGLSYSIHDINQNKLAEIVVVKRNFSGSGFYSVDILEWNEDGFTNLLQGWIGMEGLRSVNIEDFDLDGMRELEFVGGLPDNDGFSMEYPLRVTKEIIGWNGSEFILKNTFLGAPQYRFQAIQDADKFVLLGNYQKAVSFYQDAIFSQELDWWSEERKMMSSFWLKYESYNPFHTERISLPVETPDPTEYLRLAAYAYYRMIILHTFLGETDAAQIKYATLQEKFPAESPGHPYAEMATDFWNAYQSSGNMYNACAAAITYADAHPEILFPLGSGYHGWQSHTYTPADVCPFR